MLQKVFNTLLFSLLFISLFAQDSPTKRIVVGGGLGFSQTKNNSTSINAIGLVLNQIESTRTNFSLSPYIGQQISSKWILGLAMSYNFQKERRPALFNGQNIETINNTHGITAGIFSRYKITESDRLNFHVEPSISNRWSRSLIKNDGVEIQQRTYYVFSVGGSFLVTWSLSEKLNLIGRYGALSFNAGSWKIKDEEDKNTFYNLDANFNLQSITIGFEFNFYK